MPTEMFTKNDHAKLVRRFTALVIAALAIVVYVDRPKSPRRGNHLRPGG